jgi:hypothetical protein
MSDRKSAPLYISLLVMVVLGSVLVSLTWPSLASQADLPPLDTPAPPATATPAPPPAEETPAPPGDTADKDDDDPASPPLAYVELLAPSAPAGAWSVVQWQDPQGGWHDVIGWRGQLGQSGYQQWVVEAKDFGTGPFRWQIRQGGVEGEVFSNSVSFDLPLGAGETVSVSVQ